MRTMAIFILLLGTTQGACSRSTPSPLPTEIVYAALAGPEGTVAFIRLIQGKHAQVVVSPWMNHWAQTDAADGALVNQWVSVPMQSDEEAFAAIAAVFQDVNYLSLQSQIDRETADGWQVAICARTAGEQHHVYWSNQSTAALEKIQDVLTEHVLSNARDQYLANPNACELVTWDEVEKLTKLAYCHE